MTELFEPQQRHWHDSAAHEHGRVAHTRGSCKREEGGQVQQQLLVGSWNYSSTSLEKRNKRIQPRNDTRTSVLAERPTSNNTSCKDCVLDKYDTRLLCLTLEETNYITGYTPTRGPSFAHAAGTTSGEPSVNRLSSSQRSVLSSAHMFALCVCTCTLISCVNSVFYSSLQQFSVFLAYFPCTVTGNGVAVTHISVERHRKIAREFHFVFTFTFHRDRPSC